MKDFKINVSKLIAFRYKNKKFKYSNGFLKTHITSEESPITASQLLECLEPVEDNKCPHGMDRDNTGRPMCHDCCRLCARCNKDTRTWGSILCERCDKAMKQVAEQKMFCLKCDTYYILKNGCACKKYGISETDVLKETLGEALTILKIIANEELSGYKGHPRQILAKQFLTHIEGCKHKNTGGNDNCRDGSTWCKDCGVRLTHPKKGIDDNLGQPRFVVGEDILAGQIAVIDKLTGKLVPSSL